MAQLVIDALDAVTPTLRDVAAWMGTSYGTARAWRAGDRTPTPDGYRKLVRALRRHAKRIQQIADRLERSNLEA